MRDMQRSKVYAWEKTHFTFGERLTLDQCKELAAALYGARVKVRDGRGANHAFASTGRYPTITLPRQMRSEWIVAHEVAHLYHRTDDVPAHGGTWLGTYIHLLGRLGMDEEALIASAREYGLRVNPRPVKLTFRSDDPTLQAFCDFMNRH